MVIFKCAFQGQVTTLFSRIISMIYEALHNPIQSLEYTNTIVHEDSYFFSEKNSAFTPFSMVLGLMIKELHKGICLALNEKSVPVLVQLLKCLAALVQATPYHKMGQGLITKIVRNVKPFVYHKGT